MVQKSAEQLLISGNFPSPTQPNLIRSQVGQPRGLQKSFGQFAWFFPISTSPGLSNWETANFEQLLRSCLLS